MLKSKQLSLLPLPSPYSRQEADGKRNKIIFQVCVSIFKNLKQENYFLVHWSEVSTQSCLTDVWEVEFSSWMQCHKYKHFIVRREDRLAQTNE